jgi:hypothetical protein
MIHYSHLLVVETSSRSFLKADISSGGGSFVIQFMQGWEEVKWSRLSGLTSIICAISVTHLITMLFASILMQHFDLLFRRRAAVPFQLIFPIMKILAAYGR